MGQMHGKSYSRTTPCRQRLNLHILTKCCIPGLPERILAHRTSRSLIGQSSWPHAGDMARTGSSTHGIPAFSTTMNAVFVWQEYKIPMKIVLYCIHTSATMNRRRGSGGQKICVKVPFTICQVLGRILKEDNTTLVAV